MANKTIPTIQTNEGNVGIGTTNPAFRLDVTNSITSRSTLNSPRFSSAGTYVYGVTNSPTWVIGTGSSTNNNATAPDGTTSAGTYTLSAASASQFDLYQTISGLTNGRVYTVGMWVKLGTATNFCLVVNNTGAWNTIGGKAFTSSDGLSTSKWTHISYTFAATASAAINLHLGYHLETGVTQQTAGTVFLWNIEMTEFSSTWIGNVEDEIRLPGSSIWTSRGNVGIGITSPRVLLDLAKANNVGQVLLLGEVGANVRVGFGLHPSNAGMRIFSLNHVTDGGIEFGGISSSDGSTWTRNHRLGLAGGNSFFNEQGGNVGIGTNNPSAKLEVAGSLRVTGVGQIGPAGGYGIALFNDQTNAFAGQIYGRANGLQFTDILGNASVYIASGGNVGIGEQSPVAKLQVTSNLEAALFKGTATFGSAIQIEASSAGGRLYQIQSTANGAGEGGGRLLLVDKTAAATRLTIKSDGTVGIGTTNPTKKLQVAGSLYWDYNGTATEEHSVGIQRVVAAANGSFTEIGTLAASASSIRATFEIFHHDSSTIEYSLFELIANFYTGTTTDWVQLPSRTQAHYAGVANGVVVDARLQTTGGSVELRLRSIGGAGGNMTVNVRIKSNTNLTETSATGTGATVAGLLGFNGYEFPVTDNRFKATVDGLFIKNNGFIGVGTTNPSTLLSIGRAGSTTAASGITFGADAQANLYRSAEDTIKTDGALTVAGLIYNNNSAYYSSVTKTAASNWGQYSVIQGNSSYASQIVQVLVNGGNISWAGSFLVSSNISYRPNELWCSAKLLEYAVYGCGTDDVSLLVLSNNPTTGFGGVALVLKTNGAANNGLGTGLANTITVTVNGSAPSAVNLSNSWTQPYTYQIATSANTKQIYTSENGTVGVGTYLPASAKLESFTSANSITFNHLATNLNNNSPIPTYAFDVTNGVGESRSIKAGIGYERHLTNGRGTLHIYNRATNDAVNFGGSRSTPSDIRVSIDNDGNVGISSTVPGAKLDVVGAARISANILSHKTASYTTSYPGISSFGADATDANITYYDTGKVLPNTNFRGVVWTGKHYIFTSIANAAFFYDNNFNLITNSYGLNSVTLPMPSGYANPHGAAWDGRYLWLICYVTGEGVASKIVGYDLDSPSGNAAIIAESAPITAATAAYDLEYADGHLYFVRSGNVYIYKWNGSSIDLVNTVIGEVGAITGQAITYDGSYLWVTQNDQNIYKLTLDGYQDSVITSGFPAQITGWAWNGSNIVTFGFNTKIIYIINTTRLRIDTQNLALMGGRVGIGSTAPTALLNVRASVPAGIGSTPAGTNVLLDSNTSNYITFRNSSDNGTYAGLLFLDNNIGGYIAFGNAGAAAASDSMIYGAYQDHIFQNGYVNETLYNRTEALRIKGNGRVGIGTNAPTTLLSVGGPGSTSAASGITLGGDAVTNLYRAQANILKTDATLQVAGNFDGFGTVQAIGSILHRTTIRVLNKAATDWVTWFTRDTSESETIGRLDNIRSINGSVAGNLGIGTTLPSGKLHVVSSVANDTVLRADGTNGTLFSVVDDLSDSLMSVNNSAGLPVLEVFADDRVIMGQYGSGDLVVKNNEVGIGTTNPINKLSVIGNASIGSSAYNLAAPVNGLLVEGSVGIGTTSVGHPLEVYGTSMDPSLTPSAASIFSVNSLGVELAIGRMVTSPFSVWLQGKHATVGGNLTYPIVLNPLGGNVGVGLTNPAAALDVRGRARVQNNTAATAFYVQQDDGSNDVVEFYRSATSNFILKNNGNVGIGRTNPSTLLSIGADGVTSAANGITFGGDAQANIYRNAEDSLATDGNFNAAGNVNSKNSRTATYTSITSGTNGTWYPLFAVGDSTDATIYCNLRTFAHGSVSFIVARGYNLSNTHNITILNSQINPNGGYANVTGVRIRQDGGVEIQLSWSSGPAVDIGVQIIGTNYTPPLVANLTPTANGTAVIDSVVLTNGMIRTLRNIITEAGSVGIGIANPTNKLHIVETTPTGSRIQLGSASTNGLMNAGLVNDFLILTAPFNAVPASTSNNNAKWGIKMGGGSTDSPNALEKSACIYAVSEEDIGAGGAGAGYNRKVGLALHTSPFDLPNVERVRINNLGNVGIGLTNPAYRLQVSGGDVNIASANILRFGTVSVLNTSSNANDIYANIRVLRNESTVNTDGMFINYNSNGTTAAHLRFYANATNERMRIDASNGYVGVGTTVPDVKFDVYDDTNGGNISAVRNANTGSNAFAALVFRRNSNLNGLVMFTNSSNRSTDGGLGNSTIRTDNGKLLLGAGASTYHALETDGNVGIGLTNPAAARLHIKGNGTAPVLRVETADLQSAAGGTAGKTFVGWMPIMTGAAVGDKVFIPLYK